jgi:hypothetical protein
MPLILATYSDITVASSQLKAVILRRPTRKNSQFRIKYIAWISEEGTTLRLQLPDLTENFHVQAYSIQTAGDEFAEITPEFVFHSNNTENDSLGTKTHIASLTPNLNIGRIDLDTRRFYVDVSVYDRNGNRCSASNVQVMIEYDE